MIIPVGTKVLTVHQPYADLLVSGVKWVENRTWATFHRGPLLIHAAKHSNYLTKEELAEKTTGAIVGMVDVVNCLPLYEIQRRSRSGESIDGTRRLPSVFLHHRYTEGPHCWIVENPRLIVPFVPMKGAQGLWNLKEEIRIDEV